MQWFFVVNVVVLCVSFMLFNSNFESSPADNNSYWLVADIACIFSEGSIKGHTIKAWCPLETSFSIKFQTSLIASSWTNFVVIVFLPFGNSLIVDKSKSP